MKIMILGLGVIGVTYGYAFQKAGFAVEHWIRESKRTDCPQQLAVKLLDGRRTRKGETVRDTYTVNLAQANQTYGLIVISVSSNKLAAALETLNSNNINGTILLLNGIKEERADLDAMMGERPYILGYPVAGGQMDVAQSGVDSVLFDHIMLEREEKARITHYAEIVALFHKAGIKTESPHDMLEWIWLHMAINAGVITTAATLGSIANSAAAARRVMNSAAALSQAILTIRESVKVVEARGVDLSHYRKDLLPYKLPSRLAGWIMKAMFRTSLLTRRIMELHANLEDLLYVCSSVYDKGKELQITTDRFERNYNRLLTEIGSC
jgi:2-dehydropantoate 2-reductase